MEHYQGKKVVIPAAPDRVFQMFGDLSAFTRSLPEKYRDSVTATPDSIDGKIQGFNLGIKVVERLPFSKVVLKPSGQFPFDFTLNFLMDSVEETKTEFRIEMDADMNFMMKMMFGGKIQEAIDKITDSLQEALCR